MEVPKIRWEGNTAKVGKATVGSVKFDDIQHSLVATTVTGIRLVTDYRDDKINIVKKQVELAFAIFWEQMDI